MFSADTCRLVHRLDRETSGALVVARTPDVAAWLSACFREHAENADAALAATPVDSRATRPSASAASDQSRSKADVKSRPGAAVDGAAVRRMYWAVVETGGVPGEELPDSGRIVAPIWGGGGSNKGGSSGSGAWRPAATAYSVLRQGGGHAWLELRPETGVSC